MAWVTLILAIAKLIWEIYQYFKKLEGRHPLFNGVRARGELREARKASLRVKNTVPLEALRDKYKTMHAELLG